MKRSGQAKRGPGSVGSVRSPANKKQRSIQEFLKASCFSKSPKQAVTSASEPAAYGSSPGGPVPTTRSPQQKGQLRTRDLCDTREANGDQKVTSINSRIHDEILKAEGCKKSITYEGAERQLAAQPEATATGTAPPVPQRPPAPTVEVHCTVSNGVGVAGAPAAGGASLSGGESNTATAAAMAGSVELRANARGDEQSAPASTPAPACDPPPASAVASAGAAPPTLAAASVAAPAVDASTPAGTAPADARLLSRANGRETTSAGVGAPGEGNGADALLNAYSIFEQEKGQRWHYREYDLREVDPIFLVGKSVRVFWTDDEAWYSGTIAAYDTATDKHQIDYLDGETEHLVLGRHRIRINLVIGDLPPARDEAKHPKPAPHIQLTEGGELADKDDYDPWLLAGQRVEVFWPLDKEWYAGRIAEYKKITAMHKVVYDDNMTEDLDLATERIRFHLDTSAWPCPAAALPSPSRALGESCPAAELPPEAMEVEVQVEGAAAQASPQPAAESMYSPNAAGGEETAPVCVAGDDSWLQSRAEASAAEIAGCTDPTSLVGRRLQVYWKDDDAWYPGQVSKCSTSRKGLTKWHILYDDGDKEIRDLRTERVILESEQAAEPGPSTREADARVVNQALEPAPPELPMEDPPAPAASAPSPPEEAAPAEAEAEAGSGGAGGAGAAARPCPGEVVWARVRGHPYWPAVLLSEGDADALSIRTGRSPLHFAVQFFGTFELCRILSADNWALFRLGLEQSFHTASKAVRKAKFTDALAQVAQYLACGDLPEAMGGGEWIEEYEEEEEGEDDLALGACGRGPQAAKHKVGAEEASLAAASLHLPAKITGNLLLNALGEVEYVEDSFHNSNYILPVGFSATRYWGLPGEPWRLDFLCEIGSTAESPVRPLYRVTPGKESSVAAMEGLEVTKVVLDVLTAVLLERGSTVEQAKDRSSLQKTVRSGSSFFGMQNGRVRRLVQRLPNAERCEAFKRWDIHPVPSIPPPDAAILRARALSRARALRLPEGIHPTHLDWKCDGAICNVCQIAEEWEDNQFVQCDKCSVLVHMQCYGVTHAPDGALWMCSVCALGMEEPPPCAVCPVIGGAMKPTAGGGFAHVTCAMWIPELSFADVEKMEPILGSDKISKARLGLTCKICRQPYGAPIQCATTHCYSAYHPLCARLAGYHMEIRDAPVRQAGEAGPDEDAADNSGSTRRRMTVAERASMGISLGDGTFLVTYCSKCRQTSESGQGEEEGEGMEHADVGNASRGGADGNQCRGCEGGSAAGTSSGRRGLGQGGQSTAPHHGHHSTAQSQQGGGGEKLSCARMRPLDLEIKKNRQAPEALAAFMAKRQYVRSTPYYVTGRRRAWMLPPEDFFAAEGLALMGTDGRGRQLVEGGAKPAAAAAGPARPAQRHVNGGGPSGGARQVASISEKYQRMKATLGQRLTVGKSAIHGWGLFTKQPHAANSLLIEYGGELIRQSNADMRERKVYDSIVGAGTYIFSMGDERCVDATRAGTIAHLINHSCSPNCYTRIITCEGQMHVIIFALRDLKPGEELSYDYRMSSDADILPCNCGSAKCRKVVNVLNSKHDQDAPILISCHELAALERVQSA